MQRGNEDQMDRTERGKSMELIVQCTTSLSELSRWNITCATRKDKCRIVANKQDFQQLQRCSNENANDPIQYLSSTWQRNWQEASQPNINYHHVKWWTWFKHWSKTWPNASWLSALTPHTHRLGALLGTLLWPTIDWRLPRFAAQWRDQSMASQ